MIFIKSFQNIFPVAKERKVTNFAVSVFQNMHENIKTAKVILIEGKI